jgi:hypothetical protein
MKFTVVRFSNIGAIALAVSSITPFASASISWTLMRSCLRRQRTLARADLRPRG